MSNTNTKLSISAKIEFLDKLIEKNRSEKSVFFVAQSYWLYYKLSGENSYIHKSMYIVSTGFRDNPTCIKLYLFSIFLNIELGQFDIAEDMLDRIKNYRNYYKTNEPQNYLSYLFNLSLLNIRKEKPRPAEKYIKLIQEMNEVDNLSFLYQGILELELSNFSKAIELFSYSYKNKINNPVLPIYTLLTLFKADNSPFKIDRGLLTYIINWSLNKNFDLTIFIKKYENLLISSLNREVNLYERLYTDYPVESILNKLASLFISNSDYSRKAFNYYREMEIKQKYTDYLYFALIKSAYINGIEQIERYSLEQFLKQHIKEKELLPFVFHLIISNEKNVDLLSEYKDLIFNIALENLLELKKGRFLNSIYKYLLHGIVNSEIFVDETVINNLDKILYEDLFKYKIIVENNKAKVLLSLENELQNIRSYAITSKDIIITTSSFEVKCLFFDQTQTNILKSNYKVQRQVEKPDFELYNYFFKKGYGGTELLITLANHYIDSPQLSKDGLDLLKKTVLEPAISDNFRMLISATIGNYYADLSDYNTSVSYYKNVDQNILSDEYIEKMLLSYINGKQYLQAVNLIIKKAQCITDRSLFYALKQIASQKLFDKDIADVAYELILKSWYDNTLINIVFKHYNGSQQEWEELSNALSNMGINDFELDKIILNNSMLLRRFDKGAQNVFKRMYEMDKYNELVNEFIYFSTYAIIVDKVKPEYEVTDILEQYYFETYNTLVGYALCHLYLEQNITSANSFIIINKVIEQSQRDNIIFPALKNIKDKNLLTSYIEENQPFLYRSTTNKNIVLYYSCNNNGADEYQKIKMKYFKFGLYLAYVPHFYGEKISYYFSEETETGSIVTNEETITNNTINISDDDSNMFNAINNALIYEHMFKYEKVEEIITKKLMDKPRIKGWLL